MQLKACNSYNGICWLYFGAVLIQNTVSSFHLEHHVPPTILKIFTVCRVRRGHIAGTAACQSVIDRRALRLMLHDRTGKVIGLLGSSTTCKRRVLFHACGGLHCVYGAWGQWKCTYCTYRISTRKKIFAIPALIITLMICSPKAQQVKLQVHQSFHPPQISKSKHDHSDESEHS